MVDSTPGIAKAMTAGGSAVIGGAVFKIVRRIIQVNWPHFLDEDTLDGIEDLCVACVVLAATYIVPHQLSAVQPKTET